MLSSVRALLWRLLHFTRRPQSEALLAQELEFHLQMEIEENLRHGMSPEEARRRALIAIGGLEQTKEASRDMRRVGFVEDVIQDLRYGVRTLRRYPGFTIVSVLTLALGIGAAIAVLSVADGMLFRPLPFRDPDRLVQIIGTGKNSIGAIPEVDWIEIENRHGGLEGLITSTIAGGLSQLITGDRFEPVRVEHLSRGYLQTLGVLPLMGRDFLPQDHEPGNENVILLTHGFWKTRFGSDPEVVGRKLRFTLFPEGMAEVTVVGVLPSGWVFPETTNSPPQVLQPLVWQPNPVPDKRKIAFPIARLRQGVTLAQAQAELDSLMKGLRERYPQVGADRGARLAGLQNSLFQSQRPLLLRLLGAAGFLLLIACANLASLLLSRGLMRTRELGVRAGLGAGRRRIIRQLLTESLLLAAVGGTLGLFLVYGSFDWLMKQLPSVRYIINIFKAVQLGIDSRIVLFTAAIAILSGILVGIWPALRLSRPDLGSLLRSDGPGRALTPRLRLGSNLLVAVEVALVFPLTVGAALMLNSFVRLRTVDLGLDPSGVMEVSANPARGVFLKTAQRTEFYKQFLERVRRLPGVGAVAAADRWPWPGSMIVNGVNIQTLTVSPDFFETLRMPLTMGRTFSWTEEYRDAPVVILDELAAQRLWPGQNPLGKVLAVEKQPARQVIGMVGAHRESFNKAPSPTAYVPFPPSFYYMMLLLRTRGDSQAITAAVRAEVAALDGDVEISSYEERLASLISDSRFETLLLAMLAFLALVVSMAGIFGVVSYAVSVRTHEIGVRRALGAGEGDVLRLVLVQTLKPVMAGTAAGFAGALAITRVLAANLYDVGSHDPATYASVSILLVGAALAACWFPAHRASKIDPALALRHE